MKPGLISRAGHAALLACAAWALPALAQQDGSVIQRATELRDAPGASGASLGALAEGSAVAVSYTHLTLPTSDLV